MIAYKGFDKDLACTMGKGTFRYELGMKYTEDSANCAKNGFHCVEEPIEALTWYHNKDSRYCIVNAGGDISEDGTNRISCTEISILKEITLEQLAILECQWIQDHPERRMSRHVRLNEGIAAKNHIVVVRGKNPKAKGVMGSTLFFLKEEKDSPEIKEIGAYKIDGKDYLPDQYYEVDGRKIE